MTHANNAQSSDARISSTSRCYVVYDKETGDVIHIHYSVEIKNGAPVQEDAMTRARRLAGTAGANAEVIEVDPADLPLRKGFRIDRNNRRIVVE